RTGAGVVGSAAQAPGPAAPGRRGGCAGGTRTAAGYRQVGGRPFAGSWSPEALIGALAIHDLGVLGGLHVAAAERTRKGVHAAPSVPMRSPPAHLLKEECRVSTAEGSLDRVAAACRTTGSP